MKEFQISLAAARVNAGMTQEEVAKEMHISRASLVNWENGKTKLSVPTFKALCNLYGVPEDKIFLPSDST